MTGIKPKFKTVASVDRALQGLFSGPGTKQNAPPQPEISYFENRDSHLSHLSSTKARTIALVQASATG